MAIAANIAEILKFPWLPSRAATSIGLLVLVLVVSIAGLMRPQPMLWLGLETIVFAAVTWLLSVRTVWTKHTMRGESLQSRWQALHEVLLYQSSVLPFVVGGVLLMVDDANGMYWVSFGMIAAVVVSMLTTWVLLIEILR